MFIDKFHRIRIGYENWMDYFCMIWKVRNVQIVCLKIRIHTKIWFISGFSENFIKNICSRKSVITSVVTVQKGPFIICCQNRESSVPRILLSLLCNWTSLVQKQRLHYRCILHHHLTLLVKSFMNSALDVKKTSHRWFSCCSKHRRLLSLSVSTGHG